jgi:hypothetical protein
MKICLICCIIIITVILKITLLFIAMLFLDIQQVNQQSWLIAEPRLIILAKVVVAKDKINDLMYSWRQLLKEIRISTEIWAQILSLWAQTKTLASKAALYWQETADHVSASVDNLEVKGKMAEAAVTVDSASRLVSIAWNAFYSKASTAEDVYKNTTAMSDAVKAMSTLEQDVNAVGNAVGDVIHYFVSTTVSESIMGSQIQIGMRQKLSLES